MPGDDRPAIAITGVGLATSLGLDAPATWDAVRRGRSGLGPLPDLESQPPEGAVGGQAAPLPADYAPALARESRYLRWVIEQALREAGAERAYDARRCAAVLGTTLHGIRAGGRFLRSGDHGHLSAFLAGATARAALDGLPILGRAPTTCSACSSSLGAVALGVTLLEAGEADLVVAGGYDVVSEYAWGGFNSLRLVTRSAVKPFARDRDGMMVSEGYAVVVLERERDAAARGARALAVVDGWGESADAHHLTKPHPEGRGAADAIAGALRRCGAQPGDIHMIAAHATSTPDNDAAEHAGLRAALADSLPQIPVVGFKSCLGHTLGGAGAVELILSLCALRAGLVPACATTTREDIDFPGLTVAPPGGIARRIGRTLNTSLGFGGANTCVVLRAPDEPARERPAAPAQARRAVITGIGLVLHNASSVAEAAGASLPPTGAHAIPDERLAGVMNVRRVRRLSAYVKHMLAAVTLAVRDAGLESVEDRLSSTGAILASVHGASSFCSDYYSQIVREGVGNANPVLFAEGVPNAAAAHVSTAFGLRAPCQTIIGARHAALDAFALAAMRIETGQCDRVIVAAAEEGHATITRAYEHFGRLVAPITPGGVAFVVESADSAGERGRRGLARVAAYAGRQPIRASGVTDERIEWGDAAAGAIDALGGAGEALVCGAAPFVSRAGAFLPGRAVRLPDYGREGDLFAAAPLLMIAQRLAEGSAFPFAALCVDDTGVASAVLLDTP